MIQDRYIVEFRVGVNGIKFVVIDKTTNHILCTTEEIIYEGVILEVKKGLENIIYQMNQDWIENQHYLEQVKDFTK